MKALSQRIATMMAAASVVLATLIVAPVAKAETLTTAQACPAYLSIKKKTGEVTLAQGETYQVVAHNKEPPTWLQVEVATAAPKGRWVAVGCAQASQPGRPDAPAPSGPAQPHPPGGKASHLLSLSWEPTFCQAHGDKAECAGETSASPDARQLSLHGLWPQPKGFYYCIADGAEKKRIRDLDDAHQWDKLPDPGLSGGVHDRLAVAMPGVQSLLERHEWAKHGTCFGATPDAYFGRAVDLVDQINASAVGQLIAANVGKTVTTAQIRAAFDDAFGAGSADAVAVKCAGAAISEIEVYLAGPVNGTDPVGKLLHHADEASTCQKGQLSRPNS